MPDALAQLQVLGPVRDAELPPVAPTETEDRRIRRDLRLQIARLERELGEIVAESFPRRKIETRVGALGGPRILGTAELERVRDALVVRIREIRRELERLADVEEANRGLLEQMIAAPERYHWVRVSNEDIGEEGCRHWHSRPRWGILGMLLGWWRIRLSSGCPLAEGRPSARPAVKRELSLEEEAAKAPTA